MGGGIKGIIHSVFKRIEISIHGFNTNTSTTSPIDGYAVIAIGANDGCSHRDNYVTINNERVLTAIWDEYEGQFDCSGFKWALADD